MILKKKVALRVTMIVSNDTFFSFVRIVPYFLRTNKLFRSWLFQKEIGD